MADNGANDTDELIEKIEKRLNSTYKTAEKEMSAKLKGFLKDYDAQNKKHLADLKAGKITQEKYDKWLGTKAFQRKWLENMVNQLSTDATLTDVKAMSIVKGFMPEAYALNHNFGVYQIEAGAKIDTSFTLVDPHTIENLVKNRPRLLPEPSPDIPKELRWHKQKITNAITQGILQGESIPKIAARLENVTDMDRTAAIRNARTAMTGAQNAGRVEGYKYAESLGIEVEQEWLATLDNRTRDSHRLLDGERRKVGEKFSNGCRYPADPSGAAEEVYNCRCTLVPAIKGVDQSNAPRLNKVGDYETWKFNHDEVKKYTFKLEQVQKKLDGIGNKTYSGIWKDDVTLADYDSKKGSIQAKKDYYDAEYDKLMDKGAAGTIQPWEQAKLDKIEQYMQDLEEFEKNGKLYSEYSAELKDYKAKLKEVKGTGFNADTYSDARKRAAFDFPNRTKADEVLRPVLDQQWDSLTDQEKYGVWKYTENSNPMNKPLSGYTETWTRRDFKGVGNVDWGREDSWRSNPNSFKKFGHADGHIDHAQAIKDLTTAIEKCDIEDDIWLARGSGNDGLAGLFESDIISYDEAFKLLERGDIDTLKQIVEGNRFQNHAFTSTGISKEAGFSGNVKYKIFAPSGTKGVYAEPQSYFGKTHHFESTLYKAGDAYSEVGIEAEIILQRGTTYRVTSIEMVGSMRNPSYNVVMEVVDQPDYFKTGLEQTFDGGATLFKKR